MSTVLAAPNVWRTRHQNVQGTDPDKVVERLLDLLLEDGAKDARHRLASVTVNELHTVASQDYVRHIGDHVQGWRGIVVGQLAVLWDNRLLELVDWTYERANGGIDHVTPERGILSVLFRNRRTGFLHWRPVTHAVQHIEVGGRARIRGRIFGQNGRAKNHFALLARSTRAHARGGRLGKTARRMHGLTSRNLRAAPVFGCGDLNVDFEAEHHLAPSKRTPWFPYTVLGRVARLAKPNAHGGTHGGRLIDWAWITGRLRVISSRVLPRRSSDHNGVEWLILERSTP